MAALGDAEREILSEIGKRIRMTRGQRPRAAVAQLAQMSERWLFDLEHGLKDPQLSDLLRIARELRINPVDLIGGVLIDRPMPQASSAADALDTLLEERPPLEELQSSVLELRAAYSASQPEDLHRRIRYRLQQIRKLLVNAKNEHISLLESAAWLAVLDGTVLADMKQREAARSCIKWARDIASQIGHLEIVAWTYETEAWMAVTDGEFSRALELIDYGVEVAPHGGFGLVASLGQRARVKACMNDTPGVVRDLRASEVALASVGTVKDPADHYFSGPGQAIYFAARAFARLGKPKETIEHAVEVVNLSQDPSSPHYCPTRALNARLEWAGALAQQGEEEAAVAKALEGFDHSWWRPGSTQRMRKLISKMRDARLQEELFEQLSVTGVTDTSRR